MSSSERDSYPSTDDATNPDKNQKVYDAEPVFDKREDESDESYVKNHFFQKVKKFAGKITVFDAVCLYYCAMDPNTPMYAKAVALAALAYFILPVDAISDFLPLVGFTDDAGAIAAAIASLSPHINNDHREQASQFLYGKPYRKEI